MTIVRREYGTARKNVDFVDVSFATAILEGQERKLSRRVLVVLRVEIKIIRPEIGLHLKRIENDRSD